MGMPFPLNTFASEQPGQDCEDNEGHQYGEVLNVCVVQTYSDIDHC
jgi:hypothetical protein